MATPPDFTAGAILTAAQMSQIGLWEIQNSTVTSTGGTSATATNGLITVGNGNTSVTITAFSGDFSNYLVIFEYMLASTGNPALLLKIGGVSTAYYGVTAFYAYDASGDGTTKRNNGVDWPVAFMGANNFSANYTIYSPARTNVRTAISGSYAGDLYNGTFNGMLANTTAYTNFSVAPASGTFTGGRIRVYGYRD
jgi:hypothetical protein